MKLIADLHIHLAGTAPCDQIAGQIAAQAAQRGLILAALTDHLPKTSNIHCAWSPADQAVLPETQNGVRFLCGAEADISACGALIAPTQALAGAQLVVAAMHPYCAAPGSRLAHTEAFEAALKSPYTDILAHPMDAPYPFDEERIVALAARLGKPLELNALSERSDPQCRQAQQRLAKLAAQYGAPLVVSSDAQRPEQVGDFGAIPYWLDDLGIAQTLVVNAGASQLAAFLARVRARKQEAGIWN